MIKIITTQDKGGDHLFNDVSEVHQWIDEGYRIIASIFGPLHYDFHSEYMPILHRTSSELKSEVDRMDATGIADWTLKADDKFLPCPSPASEVLLYVAGRYSSTVLRGSMFAANVLEANIDFTIPESAFGVAIYENQIRTKLQATLASSSIEPFSTADRETYNDLRGTIPGLANEVAAIGIELNTLLNFTRESLSEVDRRSIDSQSEIELTMRGISNNVSSFMSDSNQVLHRFSATSQDQVNDAQKSITDWITAQKEHIRLTAPVELWNERKLDHAESANKSGKAAAIFGTIGTIFTPVVSSGAYLYMKWLLSDVVPDADPGASSFQRPTLHYELFFAGTVTLLWLTMFFWLMRILVRRYVLEHRLAVDASGRAAMTQTYLGLIKEGAASDAERPIVLGALFQPVADGGSDDGPPATSLASIVAAIVAGKGTS